MRFAMLITFSLVFFATGRSGVNARETVDWETPARLATSIEVILTFFFMFILKLPHPIQINIAVSSSFLRIVIVIIDPTTMYFGVSCKDYLI